MPAPKMTDFTPFASIVDAYMKGQQAMKGSFVLDEGMDRNAVSEEEKSYLRIFNGNWHAKSQPLSNQLCKFLMSIHKTEGMTAAELKVDLGLTTTQDVINSWCQITLSQHQKFAEGVKNVLVEMFSSPVIETQLVIFNKLQALAADKLVQLDNFIGLQVYVRYELFAEKVKGIKFSRLLQQGQGPSFEAPTTSAPSAPQTPQYKPIESFLDSRCNQFPGLLCLQHRCPRKMQSQLKIISSLEEDSIT